MKETSTKKSRNPSKIQLRKTLEEELDQLEKERQNLEIELTQQLLPLEQEKNELEPALPQLEKLLNPFKKSFVSLEDLLKGPEQPLPLEDLHTFYVQKVQPLYIDTESATRNALDFIGNYAVDYQRAWQKSWEETLSAYQDWEKESIWKMEEQRKKLLSSSLNDDSKEPNNHQAAMSFTRDHIHPNNLESSVHDSDHPLRSFLLPTLKKTHSLNFTKSEAIDNIKIIKLFSKNKDQSKDSDHGLLEADMEKRKSKKSLSLPRILRPSQKSEEREQNPLIIPMPNRGNKSLQDRKEFVSH